MKVKVVSHLGLTAGFISAFEHFQHFVGGEVEIVHTVADLMGDIPADLEYEQAVLVKRVGYGSHRRSHLQELRVAALYLNHMDDPTGSHHLMRFYVSAGDHLDNLACVLSEKLELPEQVPLEQLLMAGRYLAAIGYAWVVDSHMRGEGMVTAHVRELTAGGVQQLIPEVVGDQTYNEACR